MKSDAVDFAVSRLKRRFFSWRTMERLLIEEGSFDNSDIKEALVELEQWGYLNDKRLALSVLRKYTRNQPKGRDYIRYKLISEEIPGIIIDEVLNEYSETDENRFAIEAAERFLKSKDTRKSSPMKLEAALSRHLIGRGFSETIISAVLSEFFQL